MKTVIRIFNVIRLALFPIGYGLTGALIGGTLNRIMIADIGLPASLVGLFFAIPLLISPMRVWLGYRSDGFPIFGRRREPYMVIGFLLAGIGIMMITVISTSVGKANFSLIAGVLLAFALYGLGRNLAHNSFQALIADKFKGDQRPRAVTGYEVATMIGLIAGAGGLGGALKTYDPGKLVQVALGVAIIALLLTILGSVGQEPRSDATKKATTNARESSFANSVKTLILPDQQVRRFFILVFFTMVGTLAQDVLLEPYGALVLGMPVGDTTRLTQFWGIGVLVSMLISGTVLIKWLGHMRVLRIGIIASILVFVGIIIAGIMGNVGLFNSLVLVMGLGTGLAGAGMLSGIVNFTTTIRAGLLMGVWGMANQIGHAFGSLMGGGVVDVVQSATGGNAFAAYATVFALESVMLVTALWLSTRLDVRTAHVQVEEMKQVQGSGVA